MSMKFLRRITLVVLAFTGLVALSACNENQATTTDKCGFVKGNGDSGHNARIHKVIYPGATFHVGQYEEFKRFPCNSRNYIINPPGEKNANNDPVGDRHVPVIAYTNKRTKVITWLTAYWTVNQTRSVLQNEFAPLCLKYSCWSGKSGSGDANFATPGWNGMLAENFGPSIDQTMLEVMHQFDDSVWRDHNPEQKKQLEEKLSEAFAANVRATTGYTDDLFCGSGNSGWKDPSKPGQGDFKCTNVRFEIKDIEPADSTLQQQTTKVNAKQAQVQANKDELDIAKAKYGDQAGYWLGVQDTASACRVGSTCVINVSSSGVTPIGK
jgi:hypothetical protein